MTIFERDFFWDVLILGLWYVQLRFCSRHCTRGAEVMKMDQQLESFIPPHPPFKWMTIRVTLGCSAEEIQFIFLYILIHEHSLGVKLHP